MMNSDRKGLAMKLSLSGLMKLTLCLGLWAGLCATPVEAFDSGSDGTDGALTFTAGAGTVDFDPVALGVDADGDGVYHFTTIDIPAGTTVRLRSSLLGEGKPVHWLATGAVTIEGDINLNGFKGHNTNDVIRVPAEAGAGGFTGGVGNDGTGVAPAQSGNGPGASQAAANTGGGGAGHRLVGTTSTGATAGGPPYGNLFLLPLIGGSGAAGGGTTSTAAGGGGGAGAFLMASSVSIVVNGIISAIGGRGGDFSNSSSFNQRRGGGGSGGAIRLIADSITGTGEVDVEGGLGSDGFSILKGSDGRIRIEAENPDFMSTATLTAGATYGFPGKVFLPASAPSVRVTTVDMVTVPAQTTGSFVTPDVTIDSSVQVTLELAGANVPLGTEVQLTLRSESGTTVTLTSTPLAGTTAASTATAGPVTLPHGFTRITVYTSFTP